MIQRQRQKLRLKESGSNDTPDVLGRDKVEGSSPFVELYRRHAGQVYRYFFTRTGNKQEAEELTSQTFLAAWESVDQYRGEGAFIAWLMGIARRKIARHYRQRPTAPLDQAIDLPDEGLLPEELAAERSRLSQVLQALQALSPDRAEAIRLYFFGSLSVAEVSIVMKKSEPAVRMLLHRGIRDLKERVGLGTNQEEL
jgi:RNA polymerase sigma-70 factor (ECF subfamily)